MAAVAAEDGGRKVSLVLVPDDTPPKEVTSSKAADAHFFTFEEGDASKSFKKAMQTEWITEKVKHTTETLVHEGKPPNAWARVVSPIILTAKLSPFIFLLPSRTSTSVIGASHLRRTG